MISKHVEILKEMGIIPKTILEIGSRDGDDANFYQKQFDIRDKDVYVVEPNPLQAMKIRDKYPNYKLFEYAIYNEELEEKDFFQVLDSNKDPVGISSLNDRNDNFYQRFRTNKIKVKTIKGSTLMEKINKEIDICKIDVEGASYEVLESLGESINKIKTIHIETEYYMYWKNQKLHPEIAEFLNSKGFEMVWHFEQMKQADSIWINKNMMDNLNNIEIHTLICKKDLTLAVNNFKSLQKYEEFSKMVVVLHDDGSLTKEDLPMLEKIKNMTIIWREDADMKIKSFVEKYPNCKSYRLGDSHINLWHKIKLFDYFYFSKTKKIIGMDTDLLFLRKPENVINFIKTKTAFYFPDIQSAYCFNEPKEEIDVIKNVNTGLIYLPDESYYNIDAIEHALSNLIRGGINYFPSWIEQSAFAHMFFADGRYKTLELNKYGIPYFQRVDSEIIECLHFVSYEGVRATYNSYLEYVNLTGEKILSKEYKINFKEKQVPMLLEIYNDEDKIFFKFTWELEKGGVNALDHIFEIVNDKQKYEFKFQSEKHGFFSIPKNDYEYNNIMISHSFDWYGEKDWEVLESDIFI